MYFKLTLCVYLYHLSIKSRTSISFHSLLYNTALKSGHLIGGLASRDIE